MHRVVPGLVLDVLLGVAALAAVTHHHLGLLLKLLLLRQEHLLGRQLRLVASHILVELKLFVQNIIVFGLEPVLVLVLLAPTVIS